MKLDNTIEHLKNIKTLTFYIKTTGRNTFISVFKEILSIKNQDIKPSFRLLKIFSCGLFGFKNRRKETPYACSILANKSALYALQLNAQNIHILFKGVTIFKKVLLTTFLKTQYNRRKLSILSISDITQYPYNGCRTKKNKRR